MRQFTLLSLILLCSLSGFVPVSEAKEFSIGTHVESERVEAKVLESPMPEIPAEYQHEAFKTAVHARFAIAADGKFTVSLIDSCGIEEMDRLVLRTLKKWKFQPATIDGDPVESSRKLRIELEIE